VFCGVALKVIAEEKQHQEHITNISSFKRQSLKRTQSKEPATVPDQQSMCLVFQCFLSLSNPRTALTSKPTATILPCIVGFFFVLP
jgi:hypothetical protein